MGNADGRFYGFVTNNFISAEEGKLNHDRYEVYVNDDFLGNKTLLNQGDKLSDVDDFLKSNGYSTFSSLLEGDHYYIKPYEQQSEITKALEVYFKNR
ncbi:hypothetical protein [Bacillus sp. AK031]